MRNGHGFNHSRIYGRLTEVLGSLSHLAFWGSKLLGPPGLGYESLTLSALRFVILQDTVACFKELSHVLSEDSY